MRKFLKTIENFYWGVDLHILWKCPVERVSFLRYELYAVLLSIYTIFITSKMGNVCFIFGIGELFIYKWYLSSINVAVSDQNNGFVKWVVATLVAIGLTYCTIEHWRLWNWNNINVRELILLSIILLALLFFCYIPVRFKSMKDSQYATWQRKDFDIERHSMMSEIETIQKEEELHHKIQKEADLEYQKQLTHEIAQARLKVAQVMLEKWTHEQIKNIPNDINNCIEK